MCVQVTAGVLLCQGLDERAAVRRVLRDLTAEAFVLARLVAVLLVELRTLLLQLAQPRILPAVSFRARTVHLSQHPQRSAAQRAA